MLADVSPRNDELGELARVFAGMATEVQARETKMKTEIQELRIEIDEMRRQQDVEAIIESDHFKDLRAKAKAQRAQRRKRKKDEE